MIFILIAALSAPFSFAGKWSDFCEKHLIADDPYQFEQLNVDQLIDVYLQCQREGCDLKTLKNEIQKRLHGDLSYEDRQKLKVTGVKSSPQSG